MCDGGVVGWWGGGVAYGLDSFSIMQLETHSMSVLHSCAATVVHPFSSWIKKEREGEKKEIRPFFNTHTHTQSVYVCLLLVVVALSVRRSSVISKTFSVTYSLLQREQSSDGKMQYFQQRSTSVTHRQRHTQSHSHTRRERREERGKGRATVQHPAVDCRADAAWLPGCFSSFVPVSVSFFSVACFSVSSSSLPPLPGRTVIQALG